MKNIIVYTIVQYTKSQAIFILCPKLSERFLKITVHMLIVHLEGTVFFFFRWKKDARNFQAMCFENLPPLEELFGELIDKMILEIYKLFFDKDVGQLLIQFSERYAHQKNLHEFKLTKEDLWDFFTIIMISSYNLRPQFHLYWSNEENISCPLIQGLMPRNRFVAIKSNIHVRDNQRLQGSDKWCKLCPLIDLVNEKLIQFGVFTKDLSIDKQMVPYFRRHSCKIFIRGNILVIIVSSLRLCTNYFQ